MMRPFVAAALALFPAASFAQAAGDAAAMMPRESASLPLTLQACPVGNCPGAGKAGYGGAYGGPVLSGLSLSARTVDEPHPQMMVNLGLYIGTGGKSGGKSQDVVQYLGAMQGPGAGPGWTLNTDIVRGACAGGPNSIGGQPGSGVPFGEGGCEGKPGSLGTASTIGYELDVSNFDADSDVSKAFITGLFINTLSGFTSGNAIFTGPGIGQTVPSWHNGIVFADKAVKDRAFFDYSQSDSSVVVGGGPHATAAFVDTSSGGRFSLLVLGSKTVADIESQANSPAALNLSGHYAVAAISTQGATTGAALIAKAGQAVCFDGGTTMCVKYEAGSRTLTVSSGGARLMSLDGSGNLSVKGKIKENAE